MSKYPELSEEARGEIAAALVIQYLWIEMLLDGEKMSVEKLNELRQMIVGAVFLLGGKEAVATVQDSIANYHIERERENETKE